MLKWFRRKLMPEKAAPEDTAQDAAPEIASAEIEVPDGFFEPVIGLDAPPAQYSPEPAAESAEPAGRIDDYASDDFDASIEIPKETLLARLRERLADTKSAMVDRVLTAIRLKGKIDDDLLEEIEDILIQSDVGVAATRKIVEKMRKQAKDSAMSNDDADGLLAAFKSALSDILAVNNRKLAIEGAAPRIFLFIGVNGSGKTTTIGKIGRELVMQGRSVMMVAADTFRAAAADQLQIWAERTGSAIVRQAEGADPAAVVYEALEGAKQETPDVILIDTAGRLHTKVNLMEQLKKIRRIIQKHYPEGPHETILVLDATTGQNALNQLKTFNEATELTGLIMTKLDGTAKGGILVACKDAAPLPIFKIGIGEQPADLRDFNPDDFVEALFSTSASEGK